MIAANVLQSAARDVVTFVEDHAGDASAADWVLVAAAFVAAYWIYAALRSSTRLGPIEVDLLEHDGEEKASVRALTATFREQLSRAGLTPPPAVPAGTPQANLIAAVEASDIPQSAWIAKLLELLPRPPQPPQYKVSGTLRGMEPSPPVEPGVCGVSFWLRPMGSGRSFLETVEECVEHDVAVKRAVLKIYVHISREAAGAFPLWARWPREEALEAYLDGCHSQDPVEAFQRLEDASRLAPYNVLARLEAANLFEQEAVSAPRRRASAAKMRAIALRRYLEVSAQWPGLVESRYRASIAAAALATDCDAIAADGGAGAETALQAIHERLDLVNTEWANLAERLHDLAARESRAVLQLLKPWYALVREHRLRTQFEPKSRERRTLKHTVAISKHVVRLRALPEDAGWSTAVRVKYHELAVHWGHLVFGAGNLSWQAHYNAACFDGILLARRQRMSEAT